MASKINDLIAEINKNEQAYNMIPIRLIICLDETTRLLEVYGADKLPNELEAVLDEVRSTLEYTTKQIQNYKHDDLTVSTSVLIETLTSMRGKQDD